MSFVVKLEDVSKTFHRVPVLQEVSFDVHEGESVAITGANRSGKSVLLRLMSHLLLPTQGRVVIAPQYMATRGTFPSEFGVLIDRPGFIGHRTGLQNLVALASIRKVVNEERIIECMEVLDLDPSLNQPVQKYSMGMKQKLGLIQAFMENQKVLLLDEPFNALDEESCLTVRDLLHTFLAEGRTVIFTSHNPDDVKDLAKRQLHIADRKLTAV